MTDKLHGQLSIEYLLLAAALLAFFFVTVLSLREVFFEGLFVLDVQNARSFLSELEKKAAVLSLTGNGSFISAKADFFAEWKLSGQGNSLSIEINDARLQKSKKISVSIPLVVQGGVSGEKKISVLLSRVDEVLLIKDNKPDT